MNLDGPACQVLLLTATPCDNWALSAPTLASIWSRLPPAGMTVRTLDTLDDIELMDG